VRINQFLASSSGLSRRHADQAISAGRVMVGDRTAVVGEQLDPEHQEITLDGAVCHLPETDTTIMLHKPTGYVCSRVQQGKSPTVYELIPEKYHHLESVGRLDKDSSGLLLLTSDGQLANHLTHPKYQKTKTYLVTTTPDATLELASGLEAGVELDDGPSRMRASLEGQTLRLVLSEGRNRQIRRSTDALGYTVTSLVRVCFGPLTLGDLAPGAIRVVAPEELVTQDHS
jgi:23S rRNA pseudouridine2605 synthase